MLAIVNDHPKKQCIVVIDNGLLLATGVVPLLPTEASLCVLSATALNGTTLLDIIKHLQPDTVILDETYFLTLSLERLVEILAYPQLQVIIVSANDDRVQMYYKQQLRITRVVDLVHFIRGSKKMVTGYSISGVRPKNLLKAM